jgi:predicted aspartyl protease
MATGATYRSKSRAIASGGTLVTVFDPARRFFLMSGATSLALASILANAKVRFSADQEARQTLDTPEPPTSALKFVRDSTHRLTVTTHINGHGPYRFLVDTGADRSVVAAEVASAIGLPLGDAVTLRGVVRAVASETVLIKELSFGSVRCHDLYTPTLPAALLGADGYLGLDALDQHRVTFDFKRRTLQVTEPRSRLSTLWVGRSEVRVRAAGTLGHLRATNCVVDGVNAAAFLDTGAELSVGNTALLTALTNRDSQPESLGNVSLIDVTGGGISGVATMIRSIKLNEVMFTDCPLVIADFEIFDVWGLRDQPALLIGVNFLQQFSRVSIDYSLKELRFELSRVVGAPVLTA